MKTSLTDVIKTERFLNGTLEPEDAVVFEGRLLVDRELRQNAFFHRMAHRMVLLFHRKKMKAELEKIHANVLDDSKNASYREAVLELFNP